MIGDFPPYPNPSLHQIELDLVRTQVINENGEDLVLKDPSHIKNIRHVLSAYVHRNPMVSYVQGFNFIIARMI